MKILVTGATGFVGSHLCRKLLAEGHIVYGVTKSGTKFLLNDLMEKLNFYLIINDLTENNFDVLPRDIDAIFHTAGLLPNPKKKFSDYNNANVVATHNLLEYGRKNKIKLFVLSSTASVYGLTDSVIDEETLVNPLSDYALTKFFAECLVKMYSDKEFMQCFIFRYTIIYGDGDKKGLVQLYYDNLIKENEINLNVDFSKKHRNLICVKDVAQLHIQVLKNYKYLPRYN